MTWTFEAELLVWHSPEGDLTSVRLPIDVADAIRAQAPRRRFGYVRVTVHLNAATWSTVLVSDKESGGYALPVKKAARLQAGVEPGETIRVTIELTPTSPG